MLYYHGMSAISRFKPMNSFIPFVGVLYALYQTQTLFISEWKLEFYL